MAYTCQAAGGRGKLQRTIASFWSGSAATDSLDDSLVGRTRSCEASMDEVYTRHRVHVEDGNISSVDEGANELSVPCPNGSSSNRRKAGNSTFKDDWEIEYLKTKTGMEWYACSVLSFYLSLKSTPSTGSTRLCYGGLSICCGRSLL